MLLEIVNQKKHNKALKRDLARVAFSICGKFSGYGVMRSLLQCVPAPLNAALCDRYEIRT